MTSVKKIKVALLALVAALVIAIPTSAFARDVVISEEDATHEYGAYQIFKGDVDGDSLNNVVWGDSVAEGDRAAFVAEISKVAVIKAELDKVNPAADPTAAQVAYAISKAVSDTDAADLADKLNAFFEGKKASRVAFADKENGYSATDKNYKMSVADSGFYFIRDEKAVGDETAQTKFILRTFDATAEEDVTVEPKSSVPSVDKKVKEDAEELNADWREVADYEIGQEIPYKIEGTLPSTFDTYKQYYFKFTDTMSAGLDLVATVDDEGVVTDGVTVLLNSETGDDVTSDFVITWKNNVLEIECEDLLPQDENGKYANGDKIIVLYTAKLNENAVLGLDGNDNTVKLTFSNNPNQDAGGTPDTGDTPEEKCIVFTFEFDVDKIDSADKKALLGAGFSVTNSKGEYFTLNADNEVVWKTLDEPTVDNGAVFMVKMVGEKALVPFVGLDANETYTLIESVVPAGYNGMQPKEFTITADTKYNLANYTGTAADALTAVNLNIDDKLTYDKDGAASNAQDGTVETTITNTSGAPLPSTGGIGTTIFTIVGIALIVAAAAIMVIRRRNAAAIQ